MTIRLLPSVKYLMQCFRYAPNTGRLSWNARPQSHFKTWAAYCMWNARWPGTDALAHVNSKGYKTGNLDGRYCAAHRVIWKIMTGREPPRVIDHIDQNPSNNRWKNLRAATKGENCVNRKRGKKNTSGYVGVHRHNQYAYPKWVAQIGLRTSTRYVGIFDTKSEAKEARDKEMRKLYGDFVP